jgi:hypothetical protein
MSHARKFAKEYDSLHARMSLVSVPTMCHSWGICRHDIKKSGTTGRSIVEKRGVLLFLGAVLGAEEILLFQILM